MSKILERMKATLERKRNQLRELQADVAGFERVIAYYENHPAEIDLRVSTPDEVKEATFTLLQTYRTPKHYKNELYPDLVAIGVEVAGQDPARNLGAYLSGDKRFKSYGEGMWGLSEWEAASLKTKPPPTNSVTQPGTIIARALTPPGIGGTQTSRVTQPSSIQVE